MTRTFVVGAFPAAAVLAVAGLLAVAPGAARAQSDFDSPTLERIKARGEIRLAHREFAAPFSSAGPQGAPVGYSIELCNEVVDEIRTETGNPALKVTCLPVNSKTRFLVTNQGLADMVCGSTSVTLSRMRVVDFPLITFATGRACWSGKTPPSSSSRISGSAPSAFSPTPPRPRLCARWSRSTVRASGSST